MVKETFESVASSDASDNVLIFDSPKNKNSTEHISEQLEFDFDAIQGEFDSHRQCYMFSIAGHQLELPVNWSLFSDLPRDLKEGQTLFTLSESQDTSRLFELLQKITGQNLTTVECKWLKSRPFLKMNLAFQQDNAA